jgi:hypothetical protein
MKMINEFVNDMEKAVLPHLGYDHVIYLEGLRETFNTSVSA